MKYLIKLEDRINGREAFVVCPEYMLLEELTVNIKLELHLPYRDEGCHSFGFMGKVFVPENCNVKEFFDFFSDKFYFNHEKKCPLPRDLKSTESFRLNRVFTVKGSALNYEQISSGVWYNVRCTLIERMP